MAARLATILVAAIVGTTLIAGLIVGAQRADESGPVDLIIHNAKVYLADDLGSMADAIAVRDNKILKVGSEREIMRLKKPQTTVVDAASSSSVRAPWTRSASGSRPTRRRIPTRHGLSDTGGPTTWSRIRRALSSMRSSALGR